MTYNTIKDCAVDVICQEGDKLTNRQIADKVKRIMQSRTTDKCIAWYKNKISRGIIKVDKNACKWLQKKKLTSREIQVENQDEINFDNEAEYLVFKYEKKRTGKAPTKVMSIKGYDYDSSDRHVEVKSKRKKGATWLQLTANETGTLIKDPKYYVYLVEGDFEDDNEKKDLYIIPQQDLLSMSQLKIHARLTQLSNKEKRQVWLSRTI